jgi:hypothetical protein
VEDLENELNTLRTTDLVNIKDKMGKLENSAATESKTKRKMFMKFYKRSEKRQYIQ